MKSQQLFKCSAMNSLKQALNQAAANAAKRNDK
jgi:hypothetical protein